MSVRLGDRLLNPDGRNSLLLNFDSGGGGIPVYSLADLYSCLEAEDPAEAAAFFKRAFAGKTVILGAALAVEDRKLTSARFITEPDGVWFAERCRLPVMTEIYAGLTARGTLPGSFIFATAVNNILRGEILRELGRAGEFALAMAAAH